MLRQTDQQTLSGRGLLKLTARGEKEARSAMAPQNDPRSVEGVKAWQVNERHVLGPKLDPSSWGEPLSWHSFLGHSFRFHKSVLASPSRRRGLGKGTAFESPSPAVL